MEQEKIDYIFTYFSHLMTLAEKSAWKYWSTNYKIDNGSIESEEHKEKMRRFLYETGWLTKDERVIALIENGIDEFKKKTAERIFKEEKIEFSNCPECGKLTRTPNAKQCRHCGYDWH